MWDPLSDSNSLSKLCFNLKFKLIMFKFLLIFNQHFSAVKSQYKSFEAEKLYNSKFVVL